MGFVEKICGSRGAKIAFYGLMYYFQTPASSKLFLPNTARKLISTKT